MSTTASLDLLADRAARLRAHSIRSTTMSASGHPTTCMSAADLISALFFGGVMRYDPADPAHAGADRLVLSKGHAAPLLYAAWAEAGYLPIARLDDLRKLGCELEGHPTPRFAASPVATGSLGQGLGMGLGMAWAAKADGGDSRVYVLLGDGETAEGSVWEAAALAGHLALTNLVAIVDVNRLGQSGPTATGHDLATLAARFEAFGWATAQIDGHDLPEILAAYARAGADGKPLAIVARTLKGKGVAAMADTDGWHGKPVPAADLDATIDELGVAADRPAGDAPPAPPAAPAPLTPSGPMPAPSCAKGDVIATRQAYGNALVALGEVDPRVVVFDGDVGNSTFAELFGKRFPDRFVQCFIAEQNMLSAALGASTCGRIPFAATFAAFLTRAYDQIRMAAVSRANLRLMGSHAGVSIGEDGPSQMGLEDLAMMRAVHGSTVLYPSDGMAMERLVATAVDTPGIVYLRGTRAKTPVIYGADETFPIGGCKVHGDKTGDGLAVVGAGITLHEALAARETLAAEGIAISVVDLYSIKPLDTGTLRALASETGQPLLVVEDHFPEGGMAEAVAGALAPEGVRVESLAVTTIPTSGKPDELLEAVGISAAAIVRRVKELLA